MTQKMIDAMFDRSVAAFDMFRRVAGTNRAALLRAIAEELENLGDTLIKTLASETNLSQTRLVGERGRTIAQLNMFAALVEEGSWVEASIDTALPERQPAPKPDIRKMLMPLGPVVVFGASNFPLAFSTAGGDTASALAAGCSVVLKAHPAHPHSSDLVAEAIQKAARRTLAHCSKAPEDIFIHLHGGNDISLALAQHPAAKAVAFTGSFQGGKALFDAAMTRPQPIPVFAEMGCVNPVVLLPHSIEAFPEALAKQLADSVTLGGGQFCTKPGIIVGINSPAFERFAKTFVVAMNAIQPALMLHAGIAEQYAARRAHVLECKGVNLDEQSVLSEEPKNSLLGQPTVAYTDAQTFLTSPLLSEEIFGPYTLLVRCRDKAELRQVIQNLDGQLTATMMATEADMNEHADIFDDLTQKTGRVVFNGVPTGVEVCSSMQHGGGFPATTDARFTSVGTGAIKRFVRPVCFQNVPDNFLPPELQYHNPLGIWRFIDNKWKQ